MFNSAGDYELLCKLINYHFKEPRLLAQALTRKSGLLESKQEIHIGHNERLEFLGDSILRTVIDDILFELYPNHNEEKLSNLRDHWVAKDGFLYKVAEKINLDDFMIMGHGELLNCQGLGRKKILADTMEAIIGAVFLDSGRDYMAVKQFIGLHSGLQLLLQAHRNKQLFEAVKKHDLTKVNYWLKQDANPNATHEFSYEISCPCCIRLNRPMWTQIRVSTGKSNALDLAIRRLDGFTHDTLAIVKALLESGADSNNQGHFSHTVLHETLVHSYNRWEEKYLYNMFTDLIYLLCKYGANPNARNKAIHCIDNEICEHGYTPLELAIIMADAEKVKALLKCGADPNIINHKGQTALHLACIYYEIYAENDFFHSKTDYLTIFSSIITKLIKYGANTLIQDNDDYLPVDYTNTNYFKQLLNQHKLTSSVPVSNTPSYRLNPSAFFSYQNNRDAEFNEVSARRQNHEVDNCRIS